MTKQPRCRFGDTMPVAIHLIMPGGCACFPDDRDQWLCAQHAINSEPLAGSWPAPDSPPWPSSDQPSTTT